jgi:hypothetical protein
MDYDQDYLHDYDHLLDAHLTAGGSISSPDLFNASDLASAFFQHLNRSNLTGILDHFNIDLDDLTELASAIKVGGMNWIGFFTTY